MSKNYIVLVCGGRDFHDLPLLFKVLDELPIYPTLIIHGAANGADVMAGDWAEARGVPIKEYPADWAKYGRSAGMVRNTTMLRQNPDLVVAFPGGTGTAHTVMSARKKGIEVKEV